jgi:hypothetical protein
MTERRQAALKVEPVHEPYLASNMIWILSPSPEHEAQVSSSRPSWIYIARIAAGGGARPFALVVISVRTASRTHCSARARAFMITKHCRKACLLKICCRDAIMVFNRSKSKARLHHKSRVQSVESRWRVWEPVRVASPAFLNAASPGRRLSCLNSHCPKTARLAPQPLCAPAPLPHLAR